MIKPIMMIRKMFYIQCKGGFVLLALLSFLAFPYQAVYADTLPQMKASIPTPQPTLEKRLNADTVQIEIRGSGAFVVQTRAALNLLSQCDPDALLKVDTYLDRIQEYNRSGMEIESNTFLASNTTAFAPSYSREAQVFWYAGTIVHDAHHNWQSAHGRNTDWGSLSLEERDALESDARAIQIETLKRCKPYLKSAAQREAEVMINYLINMQENPQNCDYCKVEWGDRGW